MTGIFGILESSATQRYQDVTPTQEFFFIVTSIVYVLITRGGPWEQARSRSCGNTWRTGYVFCWDAEESINDNGTRKVLTASGFLYALLNTEVYSTRNIASRIWRARYIPLTRRVDIVVRRAGARETVHAVQSVRWQVANAERNNIHTWILSCQLWRTARFLEAAIYARPLILWSSPWLAAFFLTELCCDS